MGDERKRSTQNRAAEKKLNHTHECTRFIISIDYGTKRKVIFINFVLNVGTVGPLWVFYLTRTEVYKILWTKCIVRRPLYAYIFACSTCWALPHSFLVLHGLFFALIYTLIRSTFETTAFNKSLLKPFLLGRCVVCSLPVVPHHCRVALRPYFLISISFVSIWS